MRLMWTVMSMAALTTFAAAGARAEEVAVMPAPSPQETLASAPHNNAFGLKTGIIVPFTTFDRSGQSYAPLIALQFDGRPEPVQLGR